MPAKTPARSAARAESKVQPYRLEVKFGLLERLEQTLFKPPAIVRLRLQSQHLCGRSKLHRPLREKSSHVARTRSGIYPSRQGDRMAQPTAGKDARTNRLAKETSPYLLQH